MLSRHSLLVREQAAHHLARLCFMPEKGSNLKQASKQWPLLTRHAHHRIHSSTVHCSATVRANLIGWIVACSSMPDPKHQSEHPSCWQGGGRHRQPGGRATAEQRAASRGGRGAAAGELRSCSATGWPTRRQVAEPTLELCCTGQAVVTSLKYSSPGPQVQRPPALLRALHRCTKGMCTQALLQLLVVGALLWLPVTVACCRRCGR